MFIVHSVHVKYPGTISLYSLSNTLSSGYFHTSHSEEKGPGCHFSQCHGSLVSVFRAIQFGFALAAPQCHLCNADHVITHDAASPTVPLWMLASDDSVQPRLLLDSIEEDHKVLPSICREMGMSICSSDHGIECYS